MNVVSRLGSSVGFLTKVQSSIKRIRQFNIGHAFFILVDTSKLPTDGTRHISIIDPGKQSINRKCTCCDKHSKLSLSQMLVENIVMKYL